MVIQRKIQCVLKGDPVEQLDDLMNATSTNVSGAIGMAISVAHELKFGNVERKRRLVEAKVATENELKPAPAVKTKPLKSIDEIAASFEPGSAGQSQRDFEEIDEARKLHVASWSGPNQETERSNALVQRFTLKPRDRELLQLTLFARSDMEWAQGILRRHGIAWE